MCVLNWNLHSWMPLCKSLRCQVFLHEAVVKVIGKHKAFNIKLERIILKQALSVLFLLDNSFLENFLIGIVKHFENFMDEYYIYIIFTLFYPLWLLWVSLFPFKLKKFFLQNHYRHSCIHTLSIESIQWCSYKHLRLTIWDWMTAGASSLMTSDSPLLSNPWLSVVLQPGEGLCKIPPSALACWLVSFCRSFSCTQSYR